MASDALYGAEKVAVPDCLVFILMERLKMDKLTVALQRFAQDEEGVTAIEYGLIAALIAVVIITAITAVGKNLDNIFTKIAANLAAA
jgi:pilus assembly protein Flp/PilA